MYTFVQKEDKHFLYHGECAVGLDNNASEAEVIEEGESSNSLTTWARCKVLNLLVVNAETNFGRQKSKPSLRTSLRWKNALYKLSKKIEKKIVCKTTCVSKGPEVTLRNPWINRTLTFVSMPRETERILQDVELWPTSIRVSKLTRREFTRTSSTYKELKNSHAGCSAVTDASFHCYRGHQEDVHMSTLDRFQIIQQFM